MKLRIRNWLILATFGRFSSQKDHGVVLLVTLLLMLGIGVLGIGVVVNSSINASVAKNYIGKLQSFYAADAQVAMLAQEVYDGNADKYLGGAASCGGGGNIIQNCDFASDITGWRSWNGTSSWRNGQLCDTITLPGNNVDNSDMTYPDPNAGLGHLTFVNGATYQVSFKAKASLPNKVVRVECQHDGDMSVPASGWGHYSIYNHNVDFCLDTTMQIVPFYWCMDSATDNVSRVAFKVGGQGCFAISLDNVVIDSVNRTSANLALNKTATSSADESGSYPPSNAIDGNNTTTRWSSGYSDNQWITVDLGKICLVSTVVLRWEAAYGAKYEILASSDNHAWYQVAQITDGARENRVIAFSPSSVRYVRMHGIQRGTTYGYSIYEFEVYGNNGSRNATGKTFAGGDSISWEMKEVIPSAGFSIYDTAFKTFAGSKRTFNSQLAQYVELPTASLVNTYGAIAYIKDTLWDFHSDRTNPEFEQPNWGGYGVTTGMVKNTLINGKPAFLADSELNHNIGKWFKLNPKASGPFPVYKHRRWYNDFSDNSDTEFLNPSLNTYMSHDSSISGYDSAFYNVSFVDSLPFMSIGNGMYEYHNESFFPLDHRGFYHCDSMKNWAHLDHNYSFTMQIHTTFVKVPGQFFYFSGDDDVWVFINNNLELDLGGLHQRDSVSFFVDTVTGLANGQPCSFDFFYCERHSSDAHCQIITNLMSVHSFTQKQVKWKRSYGNLN